MMQGQPWFLWNRDLDPGLCESSQSLLLVGLFLFVGSVSVSEVYAQSPDEAMMVDLGKIFYEKGLQYLK